MTIAPQRFASSRRADLDDDDEAWYDPPPLTHGMIAIIEPDEPPVYPVLYLPDRTSPDGYRKHTIPPPRRHFGFRSR